MPATLTDSDYHRLAMAVFDRIEAQLDRWLDDGLIDIDAHRTGGLLEMTFPNQSKIIINTQPPLHEIWLAAPSGGFHYHYTEGMWLNTREFSELFKTLSRCASQQAGFDLKF